MCFLNVDVFICGGYNGEIILADLWKISLQTFQWSKLPAVVPEPAYFHCAAVTPVSTTRPPLITRQLAVEPRTSGANLLTDDNVNVFLPILHSVPRLAVCISMGAW